MRFFWVWVRFRFWFNWWYEGGFLGVSFCVVVFWNEGSCVRDSVIFIEGIKDD